MEFEATRKAVRRLPGARHQCRRTQFAAKPDNAIYHVADALGVLQKSPFPFELNAVTREYFGQMAKVETGQTAADMRAILATPADPGAIERLSQDRALQLHDAHHLRRDHARAAAMRSMRCRSARKPTSIAASFPGIRKKRFAWNWSACSTIRSSPCVTGATWAS